MSVDQRKDLIIETIKKLAIILDDRYVADEKSYWYEFYSNQCCANLAFILEEFVAKYNNLKK